MTIVPFKHILVGTDFSDCSSVAVERAIDVATHYEASLTVVHAFEMQYGYADTIVGELMSVQQEQAEQQMAEVLGRVRVHLPRASGVVRCGSPWEQILEVARAQGVDLIVMGSHGRKGLPRAILGSVAEKVVRLAPVSVLTVHGRRSSDQADMPVAPNVRRPGS